MIKMINWRVWKEVKLKEALIPRIWQNESESWFGDPRWSMSKWAICFQRVRSTLVVEQSWWRMKITSNWDGLKGWTALHRQARLADREKQRDRNPRVKIWDTEWSERVYKLWWQHDPDSSFGVCLFGNQVDYSTLSYNNQVLSERWKWQWYSS